MDSSIAKLLVGTWRLESSAMYDEKGVPVEDPLCEAIGTITYSLSMQMSVQAMEKSYKDQVDVGEAPSQGYHAYYGSYRTDEIRGTVTHSVEGSNHPGMMGKSLVRKVTFFDNNSLSLCTEPAEDVLGDGRLLIHEARWSRIEPE